MTQEEFERRLSLVRQPNGEQPEVDLTGLMAQLDADDAAYRNSLTYQQRFNAAEQQSAAMQQMQIARDYGEKFPVAECTCQGLPHWCDACLSKRRDSGYGEQCADTDGLAQQNILAQMDAAGYKMSIAKRAKEALAHRGHGLGNSGLAEALGGFGQYLSKDLQGAYASELQRVQDALTQPRDSGPSWDEAMGNALTTIAKLTARAEQAERNLEATIKERDALYEELSKRMMLPLNAMRHGGIR